MGVLFLLPFPVGGVIGVVAVEMKQHYSYVSTEVVLVVVGVLLRQVPISAVVLPDIGLGVGVGIAL